MNRIERWWLRRLLARELRDDFGYRERVARLYRLIREAAEQQFPLETPPALSSFLACQFETSQKWPAAK